VAAPRPAAHQYPGADIDTQANHGPHNDADASIPFRNTNAAADRQTARANRNADADIDASSPFANTDADISTALADADIDASSPFANTDADQGTSDTNGHAGTGSGSCLGATE
jgi:hypothetical protein